MLIHELRGCMWGTFKQMSEYHENSTKLMTHMKDFYLKHTKLTLKELDEQLKKDIYWDADQCLKKGLVDEIL
jgi:ATP-dependent protease ClpP protease subunit